MTIVLLSDFGTRDGYVAAMKGVLLTTSPGAVLVDATHAIPPQDIRAGAWALHQYWRCYAEDALHLAVVDPGVGTGRRALVVEAAGQRFVAPDNGLLAWVLRNVDTARCYALRADVHRPGTPAATFHGRDVFAHAAGRLAAGEPVAALADPIDDPVRPEWAMVKVGDGIAMGEVIHIDHFGNLVTNITSAELPGEEPVRISVGALTLDGLSRTYGDVSDGHALALIGSCGHLEISIRGGSASQRYGVSRGEPVLVQR